MIFGNKYIIKLYPFYDKINNLQYEFLFFMHYILHLFISRLMYRLTTEKMDKIKDAICED